MSSPEGGRHWLLDLAGCRCDPGLLRWSGEAEAHLVALCIDAGMRVVGSRFHQFHPCGVTGVVLLAESHLSIHTWPEHRFAAVDVYVCNHQTDNSGKGDHLAAMVRRLFNPATVSHQRVTRGAVAGMRQRETHEAA